MCFESSQEATILLQSSNPESTGRVQRFWIEMEPADVFIEKVGSTKANKFMFDEPRMVVKTERMILDMFGNLKDAEHEDEEVSAIIHNVVPKYFTPIVICIENARTIFAFIIWAMGGGILK